MLTVYPLFMYARLFSATYPGTQGTKQTASIQTETKQRGDLEGKEKMENILEDLLSNQESYPGNYSKPLRLQRGSLYAWDNDVIREIQPAQDERGLKRFPLWWK